MFYIVVIVSMSYILFQISDAKKNKKKRDSSFYIGTVMMILGSIISALYSFNLYKMKALTMITVDIVKAFLPKALIDFMT